MALTSLGIPVFCALWIGGLVLMVASADENFAHDDLGRKFGFLSGPAPDGESNIDVMHGFPSAIDFFTRYVFESKPLVMKGAARTSPAYKRWQNDEYFLSLNPPEDEFLTIETEKKENRSQDILELNFKEFLETYKSKEQYMVHRVPKFLGQDVFVPEPLQCEDIVENSIVEAIMWFSSGGTKSVVHTDSVDNMNCVYSGSKHFVMVDPHKYAYKVLFDHPEGAYADIDVDNVDYDKYSGLLSVAYQHIDLEEGDCFFIPYKWIHQVRSSGPRNIAINIWWDTHRNRHVDFTRCNRAGDSTTTLNDVAYIGFDAVLESVDAVLDQFLDFTRHSDLPMEKYLKMLIGDRDLEHMGAGFGYIDPIRQLYRVIDHNKDGTITHDEVQRVDEDGWRTVQKQLAKFDAILAALDAKWEEEHDDDDDNGRDEL